jgi:hypothetical protein
MNAPRKNLTLNNNLDNNTMIEDYSFNFDRSKTINIIDTLENIYINFNKQHNDKIQEIFELIDIETLVRPELLKLSHYETNIVKEKFGTEFNTIEYNKLITDITDYLYYNKTIEENKKKQDLIETMYQKKVIQTEKKKNLFEPPIIYKDRPSLVSSRINEDFTTSNKIRDFKKYEGFSVEGFSQSDSFMKAGDYRLCSVDTFELSNNESSLIKKNEIIVKQCYILFVCNTCVVLDNEKYDINSLIENFQDIKLIDNCVTTPFKEFLHKRSFNSFEECEMMYKTLKETIPKETIDTLIENQVKNYINWNYSITEDVADRIKVLDLYNAIKKEYNCTVDSRQFSKILLKLNLKKKRYQDGIYYYGLKKYNGETNMKNINEKLFDGFLSEREPIKKDEHMELLKARLNIRENPIEQKEFLLWDKISIVKHQKMCI